MGDWTPPEGWDSSEATPESYGDFDAGGYQGVDDVTYTIDQYGEAYQEDDGSIVAPEGFELSEDASAALDSLISDGYAAVESDSSGAMPTPADLDMPTAAGNESMILLAAGGVFLIVAVLMGMQAAGGA